ncbi:MAG TPA: DNA mismatch repair endonuclease MutL [Erysipelothrix sp.]|nr:DNA mismatch repair endonuclease MutL [Erysipelothrix sp.]
MNKVKVMHPHLANMIAAGEVVERPAGIIKELVENALDASAKNIEVHIEEGGMGSIKVVDDGEGMSKDDLSNALKRHSTSKIFEAHDLNQIQTYGFRGEALPSIASVSTLIIQTNNGEIGHEIVIDNGTQKNLSIFARNKGTTVIVENLFTQVPARLKYIKNLRYETSIIVDIVQKFAISRPDVSFRLVDDEKEVYRSVGDDNFKNVYYTVFGQSLSEDAFSIQKENFDFKIEGMFSQPTHTRSNRYSLWLYINDRMIRHSKIHNAIIEGFRRHIPKGRYPIGVLKITVDPQLVDVNVHPSKWEIRLSKEEILINMILNALEESLEAKIHAPKIKIEDTQTSILDELLEAKPTPFTYEKPSETITQKKDEPVVEPMIEETANFEKVIEESSQIEEIEIEQKKKEAQIEPLDVLAQMSGKYILAKGDKGLYIIDQHAAMERVRYEYYQNKLLDKVSDVQSLLIPIVFDGRRTLVARETEVINKFKDFQITLEVLDTESFVLREIPQWLKEDELHEFVNKTLDYLEDNKSIREEDFRQDTLATLACHSSVRFNEYMSQLEMETLVEQLRNATQPFHCPHGRPTFMLLEEKEMLKGFLR